MVGNRDISRNRNCLVYHFNFIRSIARSIRPLIIQIHFMLWIKFNKDYIFIHIHFTSTTECISFLFSFFSEKKIHYNLNLFYCSFSFLFFFFSQFSILTNKNGFAKDELQYFFSPVEMNSSEFNGVRLSVHYVHDI